MTNYQDFLSSKAVIHVPTGLETVDASALLPQLFDWQRDLVAWALKRGRAALFCGCGMGKTPMQLEWASHIPGPVLILAPLAVAPQTVREGEKFGIPVEYVREMPTEPTGIYVTNYELLDRFDLTKFIGLVLDECFAPDTPVDVVSIGDRITRKYIKDIRVGDRILNASGVDVVADVHRREVSYVVRVTIGGQRITCSPNHPYFTQRGWVGAIDLQPGDHVLSTAAGMRLVSEGVCPEVPGGEIPDVLRAILLSEMADAPAGESGACAFAGGGGEAWREAAGMAGVGDAGSAGGDGAHYGAESNDAARSAGESLPPIENHAPRTFRAWRQRTGTDDATSNLAGCAVTNAGSGVQFVVGAADSGLSLALQARLGVARDETRRRGGWTIALEPESVGREEGREAGFVRVDCVEVLESGHPDVEKLRDADGKLYLYDLGATRHPSFSVAGLLVHNSSILKSYDGATRTAIIEASRGVPFRLACTATPAPNDYMELGNHAEFLGVMSRVEMLSMFFVHDGGETQAWRLKGHAEDDFWRWVASWAVLLRKPSDVGYDDGDFALPPLDVVQTTVHASEAAPGMLIPMAAETLQERIAARRETVTERVAACAELVNGTPGTWIVWCHLNAESEALVKAISGAVEVRGSDTPSEKERKLLAFSSGEIRVLVTKSSIAGYGMNWQHCHQMAFVGLSDSWEQYYQAVRRCWRFGQTSPVTVHCIAADREGAVVENIRRKDAQAAEMAERMVEHTKALTTAAIHGVTRDVATYERETTDGQGWTAHLGDCVEVVREMADESIDFSIFSPPFASLYTYSNSDRDMGNCADHDRFYRHFGFLVGELLRVTKPGRLVSFHCMNLPTSKVRDGVIGLRDFRGELIRLFCGDEAKSLHEARDILVRLGRDTSEIDAALADASLRNGGWVFHSEVCIWKDPVTAMQRTKALGLLHKTIRTDSSMSRQGIPDYLVTMRKPGKNPEPIAHTSEEFPVTLWQRYASPVWMDINPSDTLQYRSAREHNDERHICPLQLDVIRRALLLWSNPGDLVLSPFMGIGSEGHVAIEEGRRFVGVELKRSYWTQAVANLRNAAAAVGATELFAGDAA